MEAIADFPRGHDNTGLRVVVLMCDDAAQSMADVGEFAAVLLEDAVAPAVMFKMWKALQ